MSDAELLRTYLAGWDDALKCQRETLSWVPDEHLVAVIRRQQERQQEDRR